MTVTASSGSSRVAPQRYDTLPLSSVRQAEQQDRFPDGGELNSLVTFFQSGQLRIEAARRLSANAETIVARAASRIFSGGTPLSYLDAPLSPVSPGGETALAADQAAFQRSVQTFSGAARVCCRVPAAMPTCGWCCLRASRRFRWPSTALSG